MSEPILSIQGLKVNYGGIEAVKEIIASIGKAPDYKG